MESSFLTPLERLSWKLRSLYEDAGFSLYRMGRFEEYSLYQENRRFLASGQVLTFTDLDGRLLALKPDVTLSIAKNAAVTPGGTGRFYYLENVYRPGRQGLGFREIRQMGLECIGAVDGAVRRQTVSLAMESLDAAGRPWILEAGHMGYVAGLLDALEVPEERRGDLLECIRDRNLHELDRLAADLREPEALRTLCALSGDWDQVLPQAAALVKNETMAAALEELGQLRDLSGKTPGLRLDLSLVNDMDYYNGLVLRGFLEGIPRPVLQGGQYDPLASRFRPGAKAVGFALYLDELEAPAEDGGAEMINVALPKGRLGDQVYSLLAGAGYGASQSYGDSRRLVVENPQAGIRYFLVKPSDVAIYVEHGAADVGIVGKDILEEHHPDVYELLDTGLGKCRMCVAGPADFRDDPDRVLRVATKFVHIAKGHYAAKGREIDVIKLHGSIELAPLLGLSDVIVDIVETGTTLRENGLAVLEEFLPVSARLIANRSGYRFKRGAIDALVEKLKEAAKL